MEDLAIEWGKVESFVEKRFGEPMLIQEIVFVIGLQELGMNFQTYSKEQKIDIMHIGVCSILTPFGYYKFEGLDQDGWPHFINTKKLPFSEGEFQHALLKKAIVKYFDL